MAVLRFCGKCSQELVDDDDYCFRCELKPLCVATVVGMGREPLDDLDDWWKRRQEDWWKRRPDECLRQPPMRAQCFLDWMLPAARSGEIVGDLDELYRDRIFPRYGKKWADRWYLWMAIRAVLPMWKRAIWNRVKGLGIVAGIGGALGWLWERVSS